VSKFGNAVVLFFALCEKAEVSASIEYDNGKRIPGEFINAPDGEENHVEQGPTGYKVEVGGWSPDPNLFPKFADAITEAFSILCDKFGDRVKLV
jgi:hypothetical protein